MTWTTDNNPHTTGKFVNGGGKRKVPRDLAKLARTYTTESIEEIVDIMRNAKKPSDRLKAAEILLDRGYGKAPLKIELTKSDLDDTKKSEFQLLFEQAAERAHKALAAIPALPAPAESIGQQIIPPSVEQQKSQLRDKAQLALDIAGTAGITIIESRLSEESLPQLHEIK